MGMVSPDSGEIRFDGVPLSEIDLGCLRRQIGVVGERASRFNGTLMDNLTLFQGEGVAADEAVLLDEANNGLDQDGDRHLIELLMHLKGRMTVLIITQRPSLLDIADRKFELKAGKLQPIQRSGPAPIRPQTKTASSSTDVGIGQRE